MIFEVMPDPDVRVNGKCYVCGRDRPDAAVLHGDPFCSVECAKTYHSEERRKAYFKARGR